MVHFVGSALRNGYNIPWCNAIELNLGSANLDEEDKLQLIFTNLTEI